jgi:plasmid stabilization system protein ParE
MVNIIWTEYAIEDLRLIHEYISKDSKRYADRLVEKIIERVDQLQNFNKSGRVVQEFNSEAIRE